MYIDNFIIYSYMILFYILILCIFEKSFIEKFIYNIKIIFLGESIIDFQARNISWKYIINVIIWDLFVLLKSKRHII